MLVLAIVTKRMYIVKGFKNSIFNQMIVLLKKGSRSKKIFSHLTNILSAIVTKRKVYTFYMHEFML